MPFLSSLDSLVIFLKMCTVISKGCICRYSEILVYQHVKVIISEVRASLLSSRFYYKATQLIWSYIYGFVIFTKFYMPITLYYAMPSNASFWYDCTHMWCSMKEPLWQKMHMINTWLYNFRFKFDTVHMDSLCMCAHLKGKIHVVHIKMYLLFVIM